MSEIIPAILPKSVEDLEEKLRELPVEVDFIHLDVLEEDIYAEINKKFEAHIMISKPLERARVWIDRGARRIIVHELGEEILKLKDKVEIGLAAELKVPIQEILEKASQVDFVHLMSIDALGTQGDDFEPIIFDRIREVREKFPNLPLSVDGGISQDNYEELLATGATWLVVGSHFKSLWQSLKKK